jgi:hypothetical protein
MRAALRERVAAEGGGVRVLVPVRSVRIGVSDAQVIYRTVGRVGMLPMPTLRAPGTRHDAFRHRE